jgi:hypothetical protein
MGEDRVEKHFSKSKLVLEVGDVVDMAVSVKFKTSTGDKIICGIVEEHIKHSLYRILTHAGVLTSAVPRNQLTFRSAKTNGHLGIDEHMALLPPISEKDALSIICPHRIAAIRCSCKKVRTRFLLPPLSNPV